MSRAGLFGSILDSLTSTTKDTVRKPKEQTPLPNFNDSAKDTLYRLVNYATVEDLKDILYQDSLVTSGNKQELIIRLLNFTEFQPSVSLTKFKHDVLTNIADKEGIKQFRSKKDQLEEILNIAFKIPKPVREAEKEALSQSNVPKFEDKKKQTLFEIVSYASNDNLKSVLYNLDEKVSGNKNDLTMRLLEASQYDPKETLMLLSMESLTSYAIHSGYPKAKNRKTLISSILSQEFGIRSDELAKMEGGKRSEIQSRINFIIS